MIGVGLVCLALVYLLLVRLWLNGVRPFTPTCDKCGGYVEADGCPCGATNLRGFSVEQSELHPDDAEALGAGAVEVDLLVGDDPADARRPCDAVVNGMGPYPEPWRVRCHACGEVFGVNRAGSVVRCLCSRQTLSWVDCQRDRRACGA